MSAFRFDGIVINTIGEAVPGAQVYVCTQPNSINPTTPAIPPSPLAILYTDSTGTTQATNPVTVDGNGNFSFYAASGFYTFVYFDPFSRIPTRVLPDQAVLTAGGGSVTGVGLTAPDGFAVSNSPVSTSGNLGLAYSADWLPNTFIAGPPSGSTAGTPTRRALVAADLAGLVGSVSSVNASVTPGALFTALFAGGPITSSGTLALSFDFNAQAANLFLAGPASGGSGAVTARKIQPADLPPAGVLSFSATPIFDGSVNPVFQMTLTGNVTSSTFVNGSRGLYTFVLKQDGTGGRTFAWPANTLGAGVIDPTANGTNIQVFYFDGTNLIAVTPMMTQI